MEEQRYMKVFKNMEDYKIYNQGILGKPHLAVIEDSEQVIFNAPSEENDFYDRLEDVEAVANDALDGSTLAVEYSDDKVTLKGENVKGTAEYAVEIGVATTEQCGLMGKEDKTKFTELEQKIIKIEGIGTMSQGNTSVSGNNQYFISAYNNSLYKSSGYKTPTSFVATQIPYVDGMVIIHRDKIMIVVNGSPIEFMGDEIKSLSHKAIKLAGFGTISLGTTGVNAIGQYFVSTANNKLYMCTDFISSTNMNVSEIPYIDGAIYIYDDELYIYNGVELISITRFANEQIRALNQMLGNPKIIEYETNSFVKLSTTNIGEEVDLTLQVATTFRCAIIDVSEGDEIVLNVVGGAVGRAYAFVDAENKLLYKADSNANVHEIIKVPFNAVKMIINDANSGGVSYIGGYVNSIKNDIKDLRESFDNLNLTSEFLKTDYTQAYIDNAHMVWNANCIASYNTIEVLTEKVKSMKCEVIYSEPFEGVTDFTSLALISNPSGIHNTKMYWADLNNKPKTHINIKSIHPVFTRNHCNFGIMHEGELFNIPETQLSYDAMQPNINYKFGWTLTDSGVDVLLPDGRTVTLNNGKYTFVSKKNNIDTSITLDVNFSDYCGKYCCYEFFNNKENIDDKKKCGQPKIKKIQITQSDGLNVYDNFIRPNGLLAITPAGFIWHEQATEGYYGYQTIIN